MRTCTPFQLSAGAHAVRLVESVGLSKLHAHAVHGPPGHLVRVGPYREIALRFRVKD